MHRAPQSRDEITTYYWFCLEHARQYNAAWDYFEGMSQSEIDAFRHADVTGHRPTWPVGPRGRLRRYWYESGFRDVFGLFGADADARMNGQPQPSLPEGERDALATMNLGRMATLDDIKNRFKELVMRDHPDVNGGDKAGEHRLKAVIAAYRLLRCRRSA